MNRYIGFIVLACAVTLAQADRNLDEATCPPARFIACGIPPSAGVCPGTATTCCWVVEQDGVTVNANWGVAETSADAGSIASQNLGLPDGATVMSAEFDVATRVLVGLHCNYHIVDKCVGGSVADDAPMLTLISRDPSRYRVPEAVAIHTIRETVANPDEYICECSNKDTLMFPERYRCCYWGSGVGAATQTRTWTCSAPPASKNPTANDCNRIVRPVAQCGDAGGCYCRFEYVPLASAATREPWDCGKCCPTLTGIFGRDLVEKHNNTHTNCLDPVLAFRLPGDNSCEDRGLFRLVSLTPSSGARVRVAAAVMVFVFSIPAWWNY